MTEDSKDTKTEKQNGQERPKSRPSFYAYEGVKTDRGWQGGEKLGPAFAHGDGKGHTIMDGERRIILRAPRDFSGGQSEHNDRPKQQGRTR